MRKSILIAAALIATSAYAQPVSPVQAMAPLQPLVGKWEGEGWIMVQGVGRQTFVGEETITTKLGGAAILVEGRHLSPDRAKVVHDAMAVIIWSPKDNAYRFRSQLSTGLYGDAPMTVEPGKFVWTRTTPDGGKIEYVTVFDAASWHETGRYSRDSATWIPIFEMKLRKKN